MNYLSLDLKWNSTSTLSTLLFKFGHRIQHFSVVFVLIDINKAEIV